MLELHFTKGFQQKAELQIPPWFITQHDTKDFDIILVLCLCIAFISLSELSFMLYAPVIKSIQ